MRVNGLDNSKNGPRADEGEGHGAKQEAVEERPAVVGGEIDEDRLDGVGVLGGDADGGLELVVLLVDPLVEEGGVQEAVTPVKDGVFDDHEKEEEGGDLEERLEGLCDVDLAKFENWVEKEQKDRLDKYMVNEKVFHTSHNERPLRLLGLDFVLSASSVCFPTPWTLTFLKRPRRVMAQKKALGSQNDNSCARIVPLTNSLRSGSVNRSDMRKL